MIIIAQIFGVLAVVLFFLSFQFKKRGHIITVNALSRFVYIVQYVLLGAIDGATLDFVGMLSSVVAKYKEKLFSKKWGITVPLLFNLLLVATGIALYENIFSIFAIAGILLEVNALWITREKNIRLLSFLAAPMWLTYNLGNMAYGSAVGNVFTMISIIVAFIRYDVKGKEK